MKKLSAFLLSGLLILPLAACGKNSTAIPPSNDKPQSEHQANVYEVGDIVLGDGTLIKPEELTSINGDNPPIAVIAVLQEDGTALGVGVHISDNCLPWAADSEQDGSPAFAFADSYAETHKLGGSNFLGWNMPSIEELTAIYENRQAVNASLRTIHELDSNAAVEGPGPNWYWASTPSDTEDGYAWFVHYFNGYAACCPTDFDNLHVMVVQNFAGVEQ